MVTAKIVKNSSGYVSFSSKGHAGYWKKGKDIVCAAASSIVLTSIEAIASFDEQAIDVKEKQDKLEIIINKDDNITKKLIDNMLNCLNELVKKYPKNIKIINKEE